MTTTREAVVACARALLGVRFRHQGRSAVHGLDCLGFLMVVAEGADVTFGGLPPASLDETDYGTRPDAAALKAKLGQWLVPVEVAQPGDVVLLEIQGEPQHLALVGDYRQAGELSLIHAYAPARKVVEHRYDESWRRATWAIYQLPEQH